MTRISLVMSVLLVAACDVGSVPINNQGGPDAGGNQGDGGGGGDGAGANCAAAVTPAPPKHIHALGGTSNQGQNCMAPGACHAAGSGQPFTWAGTLFAAPTGSAPNPGAQIRVKFGAMTLQATTDEDGNFYSTQAVTFPATSNASKCPTTTPMNANLITGQGGCNNCHSRAVGATTSQIFL